MLTCLWRGPSLGKHRPMLAGLGRLCGWHVVGAVAGRGGDVEVAVTVLRRVDLVALAQVLDDVEVEASRLCKAVLQQPALRLGVGVPLLQHILQGGLEVAHAGQHGQLHKHTDDKTG